ncbi:ABC transporter ATP-binding protein [Actinomadura viridis]|uniref:ATP-binding cassette subfamily B protein n=1 Tax=Actinomadura viridis TaxID=58110 RepID=A0A931DBR6_9ACTN|nr:ABC transporter ATP-binding protein [Actinomadura viridis]MBG6087250.1 ATP-binding cassette subfamily B protein [Actinomadura viridis]
MTARRPLPLALGLAWRSGPLLTLALVLAAVLTGAAPVATAWLTKLLIDRLATGSGPSPALLAVLLAVAGSAMALLPHFVQFARREHQRRILRRSTDELFAAVCRMPGLARLEDPRFHDRLKLAQQSGQAAPQIVLDTGLGMLRGAVTATGFLVAICTFSPLLALLAGAAAVPELFVQLRLARSRTRMMWETTPAERRRLFYQTLLTEHQAAKEIRLFGLGGFLRGRMLEEMATEHRGERRVDVAAFRAGGALTALGALTAGAALVLMVREIAAGRSGIGDLAVLTAAVAGVQSSLSGIVVQFAQFNESLILVGHYAHVVSAESDLHEPPGGGAPVEPLRRGIELRDVWFRYDESHPWVLRGVTLTIPYGRSLALVGLNGEGKSTIVKLLCRMYDPQRGTITWDGTDVRELDVDALRRRIGAVFQDYMSYDLTATENIGLGDLDALDRPGRIEAAARWADIHDRLEALPDGYATMLSRFFGSGPGGGTGVMLSGGQWQRVALARAVLRAGGSDLLILDEPSSGLDPDAEHAVHERLRAYREGRSSLLISHRLNTVRGADHIAVLSGGRVAEEGNHDELMDLRGTYFRLFTRQAEGFQLQDESQDESREEYQEGPPAVPPPPAPPLGVRPG